MQFQQSVTFDLASDRLPKARVAASLRQPTSRSLGTVAWLSMYTYMARRLPIVMTLVAALTVLGVCAFNYHLLATVDVSRVLALSVAFLSLWCALEHRRFVG